MPPPSSTSLKGAVILRIRLKAPWLAMFTQTWVVSSATVRRPVSVYEDVTGMKETPALNWMAPGTESVATARTSAEFRALSVNQFSSGCLFSVLTLSRHFHPSPVQTSGHA
jgi:hypothetical protein